MPEHEATNGNDPMWRRAARALARLAARGAAVLIAGGLIGQVVRDRTAALALLTYIPLPLIAAAALALDVAWKGRAIRRLRYGLAALAFIAFAWSFATMLGRGVADERRPGDREVSVLQWNVHWGGGLFLSPETWAAQRRAIVAKGCDLIVLSEAPPGDAIKQLVDDLGPGASFVGVHHDPRSPYWFRMVVCSRWPVRIERPVPLPGGEGIGVVAEVEGHRIRLLVVDGISSPRWSRLPFLHAIDRACEDGEISGRPFDLVLGDFNTPSRSVGFDAMEAVGYRLAGRSARGWRATFPSWLPVYDIDHVWLRRGLRIGSCTFFNGPHSDHRGQMVRVLLPEEHRE